MTWLSLDPSSTRTGYAVWSDKPAADTLLESGTLKPDTSDTTAIQRIQTMAAELIHLVDEHKTSRAVIEIPNTHVHGKLQGRTQGQAVYGLAVGWLIGRVWERIPAITYTDNSWTGRSSKLERVIAVETTFPHYDRKKDSGHDECDALSLGLWFAQAGGFAPHKQRMNTKNMG